MDHSSDIARVAAELKRAERILIITGQAFPRIPACPPTAARWPLQRHDGGGHPDRGGHLRPHAAAGPALCWKYLAQLGRACLGARPNAGHAAIAELQRLAGMLGVDAEHRRLSPPGGSPVERLIEIHGELAPLFCQSCGAESDQLSQHLERPLPPKCTVCGGILRPPVVLFEEMLPEKAIDTLYAQLRKGFDAVLAVGTTASFPYIIEPVMRTRQQGGFTAEINPASTDLARSVDVHLMGKALDVLQELLSHISID